MSDVEEYDVWLNPHDMDHLRDGAPVYKGVGDMLVVLRAGDWDTVKEINSQSDNRQC